MNGEAQQTGARNIRLLRLPEVCRITGLGRAMIYRLQAKKRFPQSVKVTDYAVAWIDSEVQAWVSQRVAACRDPGALTSKLSPTISR
jgi:prophage regulatory protein